MKLNNIQTKNSWIASVPNKDQENQNTEITEVIKITTLVSYREKFKTQLNSSCTLQEMF